MPPKTSSASSRVPTFFPARSKTSIVAIMFSLHQAAHPALFSGPNHAGPCSSRLTTLCGALGSLQRVHRRGITGESTTFSWWLLGFSDDYVSVTRTRDSAFDDQQ